MIHTIPKRIRIEHPKRFAASKITSTEILWPYRGVMILGAIFFLSAVFIGIWRIAILRGFLLPPIPEWLPPHGEIMLGGFLASLIIFERMIALRINALIWVPYIYAFSAMMLHNGNPYVRTIHLVALAGWLLHRWIAYRKFHRWEKPLVESVAFITLSSALMYPGGLLARPEVALQGLAFPVAVIAIERLEMSLLFKKMGARLVVFALIGWCFLWNLSTWQGILDLKNIGWATLLLVVSIALHDMALRGSKNKKTLSTAHGLHNFLKLALILSYAWLFTAAIALILSTKISAAIQKDILFHLFGLGFVFTMILGHAPLILPAALGKLPPTKAPVIPFLLFQTATIFRMVGDLALLKSVTVWQWTGWISGVIHIISFFAYVGMLIIFLQKREKAEKLQV